MLRERKGIDIAVSDIAVYGVTHALRYVVMRDSSMSKVCCKGVSAPGAAWLDLPDLQETDLIVHSYLS